jgi:hypothetical protein
MRESLGEQGIGPQREMPAVLLAGADGDDQPAITLQVFFDLRPRHVLEQQRLTGIPRLGHAASRIGH